MILGKNSNVLVSNVLVINTEKLPFTATPVLRALLMAELGASKVILVYFQTSSV